MSFKNYILKLLCFLFLSATISCSNDSEVTDDNSQTDDDSQVDDTEDPDPDVSVIEFPDKEGLEVFNASKVYDGYILVNDAGANRVYLMDKTTEIIHEWDLDGKRLGNDAFLLENGKLLIMLEAENPEITLGGFGGVLAIMDKNGTIEWSFEYSNENHIAHHDLELLPNGNILFLSWEKKSAEQAEMIGFSQETEIIYDAVLEIDPSTDEIVWEWHMWDHLIQDFDDTKLNYGEVMANPQRIDINYLEVTNPVGDVSHANGLAYDAKNDVIYISANFYSEVWVIDHSTTTEQARSSSGGNYNKGGDLLYRFGNPTAYRNSQGPRLFDRNHHPNIVSSENQLNMLIYGNGFAAEQSTAYELSIGEFSIEPQNNNEPEVLWSFTDPDLYSGRVSGVDLLPNGNRLITEGDFGFWEVSDEGEILWRFTDEGFFWRGYHFEKDAEGVINLNL